MNLLQEIVIQIERTKMLKSLDWMNDGTVYDGEVEALYQTLRTLLKQVRVSETNVGV